MTKATYGTGSSVMMNAGGARPANRNGGIATSIAWGLDGNVAYALEGNINYTGAVIKWLVEDMGLLGNSSQAGEIASAVEDAGGVYLIPAFFGLGAPYYISGVRAAITGMGRATRKEHIIRAAEECIAYQILDVVHALNSAAPQPVTALYADGGPTRDGFLMQFQSDILGIPLLISGTEELSGAGAAYCAAIGSGIADTAMIFSSASFQEVSPTMRVERREALYKGWTDTILMLAR